MEVRSTLIDNTPVKSPGRRWALSVLFALAGLCLGLWLAKASLEVDPHNLEGAEKAPSSPQQGPPAVQQIAPGEQHKDRKEARPTEGPKDSSASTGAEGTEPGVAPKKMPLRVKPGRVAYFRCVGAPTQTGPFPCPRDKNLEFAIWRELRALPECQTLVLSPGELDLEFEFVPPAPGTVSVRSFKGSQSKNAPAPKPPDASALSACLGPKLAELKPRTKARRLVMAFRLTLVP